MFYCPSDPTKDELNPSLWQYTQRAENWLEEPEGEFRKSYYRVTSYFMKDALGIARGLHEYFRNSDLYFMANYAQTVNVIGCVKTTKTAAGLATTALPLMLYRKHYGEIPLAVGKHDGSLDVTAALTADKKYLTIAVVNPNFSLRGQKVRI